MDAGRRTYYFDELHELVEYFDYLKVRQCPHCRQVGYLIRNGRAYGYAEGRSEQVVRSQRILCSNRHLRRGCGKTFRLVLSDLIKHAHLTAGSLWKFLTGKLDHLSSSKRYWQKRWKEAQSYMRSFLLQICSPQQNTASTILEQTISHLNQAFPLALCPIAAFQAHFQKPFFPD